MLSCCDLFLANDIVNKDDSGVNNIVTDTVSLAWDTDQPASHPDRCETFGGGNTGDGHRNTPVCPREYLPG
jgi:hypothetical protein